MKLLSVVTLALLLGACTAAKSPDLADRLLNPLYAEQYYDAQVEYMVNLLIAEDEATKDASMKADIESARVEGLKMAKEATDRQAKGMMGVVVSDDELATGEVLLLEDKLFTGPEFMMTPGINVHAYLSTVLDPRDADFPDSLAVDLGTVRGTFGSMRYIVPVNLPEGIRTFVLYDEALDKIVGFAQLQSRN